MKQNIATKKKPTFMPPIPAAPGMPGMGKAKGPTVVIIGKAPKPMPAKPPVAPKKAPKRGK